ncbi:MAG: HD domain-containing protein [Chloroflexota bacterium]|nr:MAG: HD domain-containing protein [Chloroflexota bacterium]
MGTKTDTPKKSAKTRAGRLLQPGELLTADVRAWRPRRFETGDPSTTMTSRPWAVKTTNQELWHEHRELLSSLPVVVCALATDGTALFVNDAITKVTGYRSDELQGKNWWDIFCPGEQRHQVDDLYSRLEMGDVTDYQMIMNARDGSLRTVLWSSFIAYLSGGRLAGVAGIGVDITERKLAEEEARQNYDRLRRSLVGTIQALALVVEIRDPYTARHQKRVTALSCAIAKELSLSEEQALTLSSAAAVHDIGKINVPSDILNKPGRLSELEYKLIMRHSELGYEVLKRIEFPWPVARTVREHHERMDGSGYPSRLAGEEILLEARILAVADVVEAMMSHRPYRPALGKDAALREIMLKSGTLYDSAVVEACFRLFTEKRFMWEETNPSRSRLIGVPVVLIPRV